MGEYLSVLLVERKEFAFLAAEGLKITAGRVRDKYPGAAAALLGREGQQSWSWNRVRGAQGSAAFTSTLIWPWLGCACQPGAEQWGTWNSQNAQVFLCLVFAL